jgi:hypothetical protein
MCRGHAQMDADILSGRLSLYKLRIERHKRGRTKNVTCIWRERTRSLRIQRPRLREWFYLCPRGMRVIVAIGRRYNSLCVSVVE